MRTGSPPERARTIARPRCFEVKPSIPRCQSVRVSTPAGIVGSDQPAVLLQVAEEEVRTPATDAGAPSLVPSHPPHQPRNGLAPAIDWYYYHLMSDTDRDPSSDLPSGRFLLRLDPKLHAWLRDESARLEISLNEYCSRVLAAPGSPANLPAAEVILRAVDSFADRLVGVIAHGSWARGDLADSSDVDLLIVVSDEVPLTRDLYRDWDQEPLRLDSRSVEAHFVHLPAAGDPISGSWAEVALDGIALLDPDLLIRRRLIEIRQRVAAGEVVRRTAGGQPYWVGVG